MNLNHECDLRLLGSEFKKHLNYYFNTIHIILREVIFSDTSDVDS